MGSREGGGDKERELRDEERERGFFRAAAMSCTSPINLRPGEGEQLAFAFHSLAFSPFSPSSLPPHLP